MKRDVFFKLTASKAKKVIQEAMDNSKSIRVDELNCSKSFHRQATSKLASEVFQLGLKHKDTMWHFCIRNWDGGANPITTDIGLSTGPSAGETSYFLWIDMDHERAYELSKKYKLKEIC